MKEALAAFTKKARKSFGNRVVGRADVNLTRDRRLPTGSLELDYGLGGGLRIGWITGFYGEKSGGKTTTAMRSTGLAQGHCRNCFRLAREVEAVPPSKEELKEDADSRWSAKGICDCYKQGIYRPDNPGKRTGETEKEYKERLVRWKKDLEKNSYEELVAVWVDPEHSLDLAWAEKIGMDLRRLLYIRPETGEEAIDLMHAFLCTDEVDFLVVDSIAQLVPKKELESSMDEWQQGLQARIVNKAVRKLVSDSARVVNINRAVTQIWINQVRVKIGMLFGDPTVKPAGKGQEFAVHSEVKFWHGPTNVITDQYGSKNEVVHIPVDETLRFKITKNKTKSTRGVEGSYKQSMRDNDSGPAGRVLEDEVVFKLALHYLVDQEKRGGAYKLGDREFTSQKAIMVALREDRDLFMAVRKTLLGVMLKNSI